MAEENTQANSILSKYANTGSSSSQPASQQASSILNKYSSSSVNRQITSSSPTIKISKKDDTDSIGGLINLAEENEPGLGERLREKLERREKIQKGLLGGVNKLVDILTVGEKFSAGLLTSLTTDKDMQEALKQSYGEKLAPADILGISNRSAKEEGRVLSPSEKAGRFAASLITDSLLDPTTYLTLGTGSAAKIITKEGSTVALSKGGRELMKDLAEEIGEKSARETFEKLVSRNAPEEFTTAAGKTVKTSSLVDKGGLKFAGQSVIPGETFQAVGKAGKDLILSTPVARELYQGLAKVGDAVGKTFVRDYGLDNFTKAQKQKLIDTIEYSKGEIAEELTTIFSKTTVADREALAFAVEGGEKAIKQLPENLQPLANRVKGIFDAVYAKEAEAGIQNAFLDDYVTHLYKNKDRAGVLKDKLVEPFSGVKDEDKLDMFFKFAKQRSVPTLKEAQKLGLDPVLDVAEILNVRMLASEKALATKKFLKDVGGTKGYTRKDLLKTPELILDQNLVPLSNATKNLPADLQDIYLPKYIADDIAKLDKRIINDEALNTLVRGYDKALNFFKGSVTVLFPAFHGRNFISNVAQNFLDLGVNALNPVKHGEVVKILSGGKGKLKTKLGTTYTFDQVKQLAKENGVLTQKITKADIDQRLFDFQRIIRGSKNKTGIKKPTTPVTVARDFGRYIENEARMVNFVENLRRGFDPEMAAARTKEFLFDYGNLSAFEKDVMRRMIPFYTWTRKNISLQLKSLVTAPGRTAQQVRLLGEIEDSFGQPKDPAENPYIPEFIAAGLNVLYNTDGTERSYLIGFDLPIESAFAFFNEPMREIFGQLSPFFKTPIEGVTGVNLFKQMNIEEDDSGNSYEDYPEFVKDWLEYTEKEVTTKSGNTFTLRKVDPWKKWTLSQFEQFAGVGRFTSKTFLDQVQTFYRMASGEEFTNEDKMNLIGFVTGLKEFTIDIEASKLSEEKAQERYAQDILERWGMLATFEKTFVPKDKPKLQGSDSTEQTLQTPEQTSSSILNKYSNTGQ